jgi:DNA-binding transcriptional MocR family regulator
MLEWYTGVVMGAPGRRSGSPAWTARVAIDSVSPAFTVCSFGIGLYVQFDDHRPDPLKFAPIEPRFNIQSDQIGLIMPNRLQTQLGDWSSRQGPLYRCLADALRAGIERGEIEPGAKLPPERVLARQLAVSRTTVVQAYDVLRGDEWLESRQGSGTWVRRTPPAASAIAEWAPPGATVMMKRDSIVAGLTARPGTIDLTCACLPPLPGLVEESVAGSAAALREATREHGYSVLGLPALRRAIARHLERRGLPTAESQVLVTSGAQQAIALVGALFLRRNDTALVESPTFLGALDALGAAGANLAALPVGSDGVRLDVVRDVVRQRPARLMYLTPTFHNPTGGTLPEGARREIARLAADARIPLVEDESLVDMALEDEPPPPAIAALAPKAPVMSIGSLSKLCWGGLRMGWVRAPEPVLLRLASLSVASDLGSAMLSELVAVHLLERADEVRRLRRAQVVRQRDALASALRRRLPEWSWTLPGGGLSMWVRLPHGDASEFAQVARRRGVSLLPGPSVSPDGGHAQHLRLVYVHEPQVIAEAVERLAQAWDAYAPMALPQGREPGVIV